MTQTLTPWSPELLESLENLIAPGGRARLSPYVETTQFRVLFGLLPDPKQRRQEMGAVLKREEKLIQALARHWTEFTQAGKEFNPSRYAEPEFLQSYLIYYFSVNIAKLQICLLDLLRAGELRFPQLQVLDIGLGAGTTFIAVLDFLAAWKTVCDLYSVPFPISQVRLVGLDQSSEVIQFAEKVIRAYGEVMAERNTVKVGSDFDFLLDAVQTIRFSVWDLAEHAELPSEVAPNLVVASNVYNELLATAKNNLTNILINLSEDATVFMLDPGDEKCARNLMGYREELSATRLFSRQGPCGEEAIGSATRSCRTCWNARRHSFHQPALYLAFREAATQFLQDKRSLDQFENNLLSWSSFWIKRGRPTIQPALPPFDPGWVEWPESRPIRYIGKYRCCSDSEEGPAVHEPDRDVVAPGKNGWVERWKFCSHGLPKDSLVIDRQPGIQLPPLDHGQMLQIRGGKIKSVNGSLKIELAHDSLVEISGGEKQAFTFLPEFSEKTRSAINEIGYRLFGFPEMRDFQHRIFARVMTGRSILGIAATGSGKSECFILPAMVLSGVTIVVSPLKSLMTDQYDQRIQERYGLAHLATFINGDVPFKERQRRLRRLEMGFYKLVYLTPEQLERSYVLTSLRRAAQNAGVRYLAMDEAHCISQWGHDFRPSYLNLVRRMRDYGVDPVRIALTATASPYVRKDICEELGLNPDILEDGGDVYVESSNRPELNFIVRVKNSTDEKADTILDDLQALLRENQHNQTPGAAIVFMPHTGYNTNPPKITAHTGRMSARVSDFAGFVERQLRRHVAIYHGKMEMDAEDGAQTSTLKGFGDMSGRCRRGEQQRFIKGETPIMVATKGFGMGIDKDNVRLIIHRTPPSNLEAYAQEAGRAGRDGDLANVILYYSPDAPEEDNGFGKINKNQSDYEIQEFFLKERYIRCEDVLVMRAFLKSVERKVGKNLYFTNDEAIAFFDRCATEPSLANLDAPFRWPKYPDRRPNGFESQDHQTILNRGYQYANKTKYLDRILNVLYRVRPELPGYGPRIAFLELVQDAGASIIKPNVKNARAILLSNTYFGEILRQAGLDEGGLCGIIQQESLFSLAEKLGLSLYETSAMLSDIKLSEGVSFNGNGWSPSLLDFKTIAVPKFGPASGKTELPDWRAYAGAVRRAYTPEAERRAKAAGRGMKTAYDGKVKPITTDDDWFGWSELPYSKGWEATPGPAFEADDRFQEYLQAFMTLHDQRKENDWAAYHRMLADYIGVQVDGKMKSDWRRGNCLRAVLLGYLETFELVVGDNCYSCSRCVPDENFYHHSLEERKSVVVRMLPAIADIFDAFKTAVNTTPSEVDQTHLFQTIRNEEAAGRSLKAYFSGWSGRMLDQTPGHRSAMWLRFAAMSDDLIPLQAHEFFSYARHLLEVIGEGEKKRCISVFEGAQDRCSQHPEYWDLVARYYRQSQQPIPESEALKSLCRLCTKDVPLKMRAWLHSAVSRLADLHVTGGPLPNPQVFALCLLFAARTADDFQTASRFYSQLTRAWSWLEVEKEIHELNKFTSLPDVRAGVYLTWLAGSPHASLEVLIRKLKSEPGLISQWSDQPRTQFLQQLSRPVVLDWPEALVFFLQSGVPNDDVLEFGLPALLDAKEFGSPVLQRIAKALLQRDSNDTVNRMIREYGAEALTGILDRLTPLAEISSFADAGNWIAAYPDEYSPGREAGRFLVEASRRWSDQAEPPGASFLNLALHSLNDPEIQDTTEKVLTSVALNEQTPFQFLLKNCRRLGVSGQRLAEAILEEALKGREIRWLSSIDPIDLPSERWKNVRLMVSKANVLTRFRMKGFVSQEEQKNYLAYICAEFNWQKDPEQADMLASILIAWCKTINPTWKTPFARLAEVLTLAGRGAAALEIANKAGLMYILLNGRKVMVVELVGLQKKPIKTQSISSDYQQIVRNILNL